MTEKKSTKKKEDFEQQQQRNRKINYLLFFFLLIFLVLFFRLFYLQNSTKISNRYKNYFDSVIVTSNKPVVRFDRGSIYAENGDFLAYSTPEYVLYFDVQKAFKKDKDPKKKYSPEGLDSLLTDKFKKAKKDKKLDSLCRIIAQIYDEDKTASDYKKQLDSTIRLTKNKLLRFSPTKIGIEVKAVLKNTPMADYLIFRLQTEKQARKNPYSPLAQSIISNDKWSVEKQYDFRLTSQDPFGFILYKNEAYRPIDIHSHFATLPKDVYLTLSMDYQRVCHELLLREVKKYKPKWATLALMEVKTGKLRAVVNLTEIDGEYRERDNHAFSKSVELGSTLKLATMAALFENTPVQLNQTINVGDGTYQYNTKVLIKDTNLHGTITVQEAIEKSSNVAIAKLMEKYFCTSDKATEMFYNSWKKYHLTKFTTPFSEPIPEFLNKGNKDEMMYISRGYGIRISPIQLLAFYNAIANSGQWIPPQIISKVVNGFGVIEEQIQEPAKIPIFSKEIAEKLTFLAEGVVKNGSGANAFKGCSIRVAGKTGTAELYVDKSYSDSNYNTTFAGFFPADNPKFSCIITMSDPQTNTPKDIVAGAIICPVYRKVVEKIYEMEKEAHPFLNEKYTKLPNSETWGIGYRSDFEQISKKNNIDLDFSNENTWYKVEHKKAIPWRQENTERYPNLTGMSLRNALYFLENSKNIEIQIRGKGRVRRQTLIKGKSDTIKLFLEH